MKITEDKIRKANELKEKGYSVREIAVMLNCGKSTISRWLKNENNSLETLSGTFPMNITDNAVINLIRNIDSKSYHLDSELYRSFSLILLKLIMDLFDGMDEEDNTTYYPVERDLILKLTRIIHKNQSLHIYDVIKEEILDLTQYYTVLRAINKKLIDKE